MDFDNNVVIRCYLKIDKTNFYLLMFNQFNMIDAITFPTITIDAYQ